MSKNKSLVTGMLGFELTVKITVGELAVSGRHKSYEDEHGNAVEGEVHEITLAEGLEPDYLLEVVAHEVYHLFYSVRPFIKVGEEEEATVFGQLVKHIYNFAKV